MSRIKFILALFCCAILPLCARAQGFTVSGTVVDKDSGEPVEFATVVIEASEQWAVADAKGRFVIKNISVAKSIMKVDCLGYVTWSREITLSKDISNFKIQLSPDNLALESAVVTAQEDGNSATTARTIDKTALEHVQLMNVSDISSLLPGGATKEPALTSEQQFNIRADKAESGNASFGTAVEVDGVRLSNNASFTNNGTSTTGGNFKGVSTNSIASSNVESVEVITGVPSVEYGDMASGVVKINTKKGKTPWNITMSTGPRNKQVSVSKGFGLGFTKNDASRGVLNASLERTRSISDPMSPYTAYDRNQLSLTWSNQLAGGVLAETPLRLSVGLAGNLGGLDNRSDPDKHTDVFLTQRDNSVRANLSANWLLSKSWITNLELNASIIYSDKLQRENSLYHSAATSTSLHSTRNGYYMSAPFVEGGENAAVLVDKGNWYNVMALDDRPLNSKVTLKANWAKNVGIVNSKVKLGVDWTTDKNYGVGEYSEELAKAPTYREWRFCDVPVMTNLAAFAEENLMFRFGGDARLNLIAGLRWDNTIIPESAYGVTSSLSPRFNAKYTFFTQKSRGKAFFRELAVRASWGVAVKQPSFSVLYPKPSYFDINVFTSTADANNVVNRAYYVMPRTINYNADLVWQRNRQSEVGIEANLGGTKVSLAAFYNKTLYAYDIIQNYERFEYIYTPTSAVQGISIPATERLFSIDPVTGVVTVTDRSGAMQPAEVAGQNRKQFVSSYFEDNDDTPVTRYGLEWVVDFPRIKPLNTTIRLDGTFYSYRSLYTDMLAYCPTTRTSSDGGLYKYVGFFYGGRSITNGKETRTVRTNLTFTTNIPQARMILSLKLESCLLSYARGLSERADGSARSYVMTDPSNVLSISDESVYVNEEGCYSVVFPDTFCSFDDPAPKPFLETFMAAKENNPALYSDLRELVLPNDQYSYYFLKDFSTPYFSANFSVTKEIGDLASISFYANNFFNNMGQVYSTKTRTWSSVTSYIPRFHYGLTVRLKF